jgi:UPF0755 protein
VIARILAVCVFLLVVVAGYAVLALPYAWTARGPLPQDTLVYIPPRTSTPAIADILQNSGAIESPWLFLALAYFEKPKSALKAGEYNIPARASLRQIVQQVRAGKTYARQITIPEGLTSAEIVARLNAEAMLTGIIAAPPPEGSLLPETYAFSRGDTRAAVVARMQAAMAKTLATLWAARGDDLVVTTPEEAVVLASIVEKETGVKTERARVAGVFANRLRRGMPLQSDPTVIYALTEGRTSLDRALTRADLAVASPFNTYHVPGLPPAPIANPGKESLSAVLHPETHDFYYFVADGTGGHRFAHGLKDHNKNVKNWRSIQKKD